MAGAHAAGTRRFGAAGNRQWLWVAILGVFSIAFSLVFACATPFVALATFAALNLGQRDAAIVTGLVWVANQVIGYGILGYPQTFDSLAWGVAIGVAAYAGLLSAWAVKRHSRSGHPLVVMAIAFAAAFVAYEATLYAASIVRSDSDSAFTGSIILYILQVNALALGGLILVKGLSLVAGLGMPSTVTAATPRHGYPSAPKPRKREAPARALLP